MLNRRYVHADAGRVAALLFAIAGLVCGFLAARLIANAPPAPLNAVIWAVIAGLVAYMVFASEGPQQRPASVVQAAVADGVVAGMIAGAAGAALDILAASGAGSSDSRLTLGKFALAFIAGLLAGGVVGAPVGWAALLAGGRERFERSAQRSRRKEPKAPRSGARPAPANRKKKARR